MFNSYGVGCGDSNATISGFTYFITFIGSFSALSTSLNYFNEESPRCSAAYINEYIIIKNGYIFCWFAKFSDKKLACPLREAAYAINWLQAK